MLSNLRFLPPPFISSIILPPQHSFAHWCLLQSSVTLYHSLPPSHGRGVSPSTSKGIYQVPLKEDHCLLTRNFDTCHSNNTVFFSPCNKVNAYCVSGLTNDTLPDEADNCILLNEPTKINQQKTDKPRGKSINFNVGNQQRDRNRDCQTMTCGLFVYSPWARNLKKVFFNGL